jgi:hypothetical protein
MHKQIRGGLGRIKVFLVENQRELSPFLLWAPSGTTVNQWAGNPDLRTKYLPLVITSITDYHGRSGFTRWQGPYRSYLEDWAESRDQNNWNPLRAIY